MRLSVRDRSTYCTHQIDQVAAAVRGQLHAGSKAVVASTITAPTPTPSLSEITAFFRHIYHKSKLNVDCIILSLIYVERLLKDTQGQLRPTAKNWKSLLMASLILASKVRAHTYMHKLLLYIDVVLHRYSHVFERAIASSTKQQQHLSLCNSVGVMLQQVSDDLSFWNVDFCQVERSFTLARINALEVAVLEALKFNVAVGASEYGKYYFALRQMSAKSEQTSSSKDKDNSDASSTTANHHIQHARSDGDSGIYDGSAYDEHTAADKLSPSKLAARSSTTSLEQLHDDTAAAATSSTSADTTQYVPSMLQNAEPVSGSNSSSNGKNNNNSSSSNDHSSSSNSKAQSLAAHGDSSNSAGAVRAAAWSVKP
eukprot:16699-Heterococcus_DN1.PRE.4